MPEEISRIVPVAALTGAREGELFALRAEDDLAPSIVAVVAIVASVATTVLTVRIQQRSLDRQLNAQWRVEEASARAELQQIHEERIWAARAQAYADYIGWMRGDLRDEIHRAPETRRRPIFANLSSLPMAQPRLASLGLKRLGGTDSQLHSGTQLDTFRRNQLTRC
jgi:hypothetical protein